MDGQSATYGRPGLAEANRLDAFVDAAFAFAVSLLIIAGGAHKAESPIAGTGLSRASTGAGEEIRTLDPNLGKVVLYH